MPESLFPSSDCSCCAKAPSSVNDIFANTNAVGSDLTKSCYTVNRWCSLKACFYLKKYISLEFILGDCFIAPSHFSLMPAKQSNNTVVIH